MKKILSFVLVLAMIASMMCISVSAAGSDTNADGTEHLVGTRTGAADGPATDGVAGFESTGKSADVIAHLDGAIVIRYAVEIEYTVSDIVIEGEATWNVNTLVYDNNLTYTSSYVTEADLLNNTAVDAADFTVYNYSDLAVEVALSATLNAAVTAYADGFHLSYSNGVTVDGAYNKALAEGKGGASVDHETVNVAITCSDWARAFAQMQLNNTKGAEVTLATVTISVQPALEAHRTTPTTSTTPAESQPQG